MYTAEVAFYLTLYLLAGTGAGFMFQWLRGFRLVRWPPKTLFDEYAIAFIRGNWNPGDGEGGAKTHLTSDDTAHWVAVNVDAMLAESAKRKGRR